jgi:hypothetical protein
MARLSCRKNAPGPQRPRIFELMRRYFLFLLLCGLLSAVPGFAQTELPPPGGWPLRHVRVLRVVPLPPGGLVPYRQGDCWGYADTTGRVWIRPELQRLPSEEFHAGVRVLSSVHLLSKSALRRRASRRRPPDRYLCNARGEMLREPGRQRQEFQFRLRPDSAWVVAPAPKPVRSSPVADGWLHRYEAEPVAQLGLGYGEPRRPLAAQPFYAVRQISRLRPTHLRWFQGRCGDRRQERVARYRHHGQVALYNAGGRRLTDFCFTELRTVGPNCLIYSTPKAAAQAQHDYYPAVRGSGIPQQWYLEVDQELGRYGLLDRAGRPRTEPRYTRLLQVGPNAVWAALVQRDTLTYGLLDTLGRVVLPFAAGPLSLPDSAGLVRRRSAAPLPDQEYNSYDENDRTRYPAATTTRYYRLDGQPAFAGRFTQAGAFWDGQALVQRSDGQWGFLDLNGHWQPSPIAADRQAWRTNPAQRAAEKATDPLELF